MQNVSVQNVETTSKLVNFLIKDDVGTVKQATAREEFVRCVGDLNIPMEKVFIDAIKKHCYSDNNEVLLRLNIRKTCKANF